MNLNTIVRDNEPGSPAASVHRAFQARWLAETHGHLSAACDPHAGFWDRRKAMRYLADRFEQPFRLECELLEMLLPGLDLPAASRLVDDRNAIGSLRRDFEEIADTRGSGIAAAAIACSLLATLGRWSDELARALSPIPESDLAPAAGDVIARMNVFGKDAPS